MALLGGKLTLLGEQPLPLQDGHFEAHIATVTAVSVRWERQLGGTAGHQSLHTWGIQASHALALIQPQLASRVLQALPLLEARRERYNNTYKDVCFVEPQRCNPETLIGHIMYLSWLLAGGLILCPLAKVFDPLVFWQEVLLLRHFLPIRSLVRRFPERTRKHAVCCSTSQRKEVWTKDVQQKVS